MDWEIEFTDRAVGSIRKLDKHEQIRIKKKLEKFLANLDTHGMGALRINDVKN